MEKSDLENYTLNKVDKLEKIWKIAFQKKLSTFNSKTLNILDWNSFTSSDKVDGVFVPYNELDDKKDYIISNKLHLYPSYYEVISVFKEIFLTLIDSFDINNILKLHHLEWSSLLDYSDFCVNKVDKHKKTWENIIKDLWEKDLVNIIRLTFIEIVKSIIEWLPIVSDLSNKEYLISRTPLLWTENSFNINCNNDNVCSFEWPQWMWKSTQIKKLKSFLKKENIPISKTLAKDNDPSKIIVEWENRNKSIMPFLERQRIARKSYEARFDFVSNSNNLALLDRSIFSLALFHLTMSRNISKEHRIKDIDELWIWYNNILKKYNSKILVLISENIFEQFFRMRKDKNYSNQNSDIVAQVLENIFYRLLIKLWIWEKINTDNSDIKTVSKKIIDTMPV